LCWIALTLLIGTSCKRDVPFSPGTRDNKPPVSNAGPDQAIMKPQDNTRLRGDLSHDPDGGIVSYKWTTVAGPNSPNLDTDRILIMGLKPYEIFVYNLKEGVYQFELMVTDNDNATSRDTMKLTVLPDSLTQDPFKQKRFDNLWWGDSCAIRISSLSATIPSSGSIQVFLQRYYGGGVMAGPFFPSSGWFQIQPIRSSGFRYEIKNNVLIIHAAANIVCDWDDAVYDVLLRWN
ncbi:MAG: hypothetical protein V4676_04680, partial [Bacteroidota bacterium]